MNVTFRRPQQYLVLPWWRGMVLTQPLGYYQATIQIVENKKDSLDGDMQELLFGERGWNN